MLSEPVLRSNSYHLTPVRDVARVAGEPCPLVRDEAVRQVPSRARALWLVLKDRMRLFETATRDFAEDELYAIKYGTGQIYLDVSRKVCVDDFARDLKRLVPVEECRRCSELEKCAGAYQISRELDFSAEEEALRRVLGTLRGTVVDLGCGHAPYADWLAPAAEGGQLQYVGIEPDTAVRQRLAERRPWAKLFRSLDQAPSFIDHAMLLRSINHLPDPKAVVADLVARLAAGGTLLIVDNVAFGVVRTLEQALRAETSPAQFEHVNNASAQDIQRLLTDLPLELKEQHAVTPETSNQWMLRYERRAG